MKTKIGFDVLDSTVMENLLSAATHHEGDLLVGLRLPADHEDAAAEDEQAHAQQHQDPRLHTQDGADVVRGEIADHAHHQH